MTSRVPQTPTATFSGENLTTPYYAGPPPTPPPPVLLWTRIYAGLMALMYVLCVAAGPFLMLLPSTSDMEQMEGFVIGLVCVLIGLPLLALYGVTTFMPRRPWMWVVGIISIAIGMTSACCVPAAIPLLIYWLKPETKSWFHDNAI